MVPWEFLSVVGTDTADTVINCRLITHDRMAASQSLLTPFSFLSPVNFFFSPSFHSLPFHSLSISNDYFCSNNRQPVSLWKETRDITVPQKMAGHIMTEDETDEVAQDPPKMTVTNISTAPEGMAIPGTTESQAQERTSTKEDILISSNKMTSYETKIACCGRNWRTK